MLVTTLISETPLPVPWGHVAINKHCKYIKKITFKTNQFTKEIRKIYYKINTLMPNNGSH